MNSDKKLRDHIDYVSQQIKESHGFEKFILLDYKKEIDFLYRTCPRDQLDLEVLKVQESFLARLDSEIQRQG